MQISKFRFRDKSSLFFLLITVAALIFQLLVFPSTMVGGDEGRYIQDALRISGGEIPVADYTTRAPILLYLMYLSSKVFGLNLLSFRLPVMIFSALTAGVIFLLGKELRSRKIGIISAGVYALGPITLWGNQLIKSENLAVFLVALSALMLVKGLKSDRYYFFLFSGFLVGLAYIERQSAAAFLVAATLFVPFVFWKKERSFRDALKKSFLRGLIIFAGFLVGFLPVFLYIFFRNPNRAVELWLSLFLVKSALLPVEQTSSLYQFARGWILTFVEDVAVQGWIMYFAATFYIIYGVRTSLDFLSSIGERIKKIIFLAFFALFVALPFYLHSFNILFKWYFAPIAFLLAAIGGTLFWYVAFSSVKQKKYATDFSDKFSFIFIAIWLFSVFIVYSFYSSGYEREFLVPLSIATGFVIHFVFHEQKKALKNLVLFSLVILWVSGALWFSDPRTGGWWWRQETIDDVKEFLLINTKKSETIFTANPLPVLLAERKVFKRLNPYAFMLATDDDTGWGTQPSPNEIQASLESSPPEYLIYDGRMERNFINKVGNERLRNFIDSEYIPVARFGSGHRQDWAEVWKLREI